MTAGLGKEYSTVHTQHDEPTVQQLIPPHSSLIVRCRSQRLFSQSPSDIDDRLSLISCKPPIIIMPSTFSSLLAAAAASFVVGVAVADSYDSYGNDDPCEGRPTLTCSLASTKSLTLENLASTVIGTAKFTPEATKACSSRPATCVTRIAGAVTGLGDSTPHGWHIHEFGDISASDGTATGGHYNPEGVDHALPDENGGGTRHVGDLGNLFPSGDGSASFNYIVDLDTTDVVGRGVIVHAAEDDGGQPTGNAGARIAQCVLGFASVGEE